MAFLVIISATALSCVRQRALTLDCEVAYPAVQSIVGADVHLVYKVPSHVVGRKAVDAPLTLCFSMNNEHLVFDRVKSDAVDRTCTLSLEGRIVGVSEDQDTVFVEFKQVSGRLPPSISKSIGFEKDKVKIVEVLFDLDSEKGLRYRTYRLKTVNSGKPIMWK